MGDIRVTQEAVEVLAVESSSVHVTQQALQVLAEDLTVPEVQVTQALLELLADPPGTITTTQAAINVLATAFPDIRVDQLAIEVLAAPQEVAANIQVSQIAVQVLADVTAPSDPGDKYVTPPTPPTTLTDTLSTIRTLQFVPDNRTKFLILAQITAGKVYGSGDACQTVLGQSALLVNGLTVATCDIGNLQTYYCLDAEVGTTYTIQLQAKKLHSDGSDSAYCARIAALGLDNWYRIEQGADAAAELPGPYFRSQETLMEDIIEPKFGNSLVFNYAEVMADDIQGIRTNFAVEFDSPKLKNYKPIDMVVQQKLGFQEDFTDVAYDAGGRWSCMSSANLVDFRGSRTSVTYKSAKLDGPDGSTQYFRRLRTVIVPIYNNPIGTVHSIFSKSGEEVTGNQSESITLTPSPRTVAEFSYLVLANIRTNVNLGDGPSQAVFRYNGLGMVGSTSNMVGLSGLLHVVGTTSTYLAGVTFGLQNDDLLAVKTYNSWAGSSNQPGYNGEQFFGFDLVAATTTMKDNYMYYATAAFQSETEVVSKQGDKLLAVVQIKNPLVIT